MTSSPNPKPGLRRLFGAGAYFSHALGLVWQTNRRLTLFLAFASIAAGVLPVGVAWVGKLVIDRVIHAASGQSADERHAVFVLLGIELALIAALLAAYRALSVFEALLRVQLAQRVKELVLDKALTLELSDFENPELYDQLTRVRREAASRPLSLVRSAMQSAQETLTLAGYAILLFQFSPWILLVLLAAALPGVIAEVKFNADSFRLFRTQTSEARRQDYLETLLSREDHVKEVRLYGLGGVLRKRHRDIFERLYGEDRRLVLRRGTWGFLLAFLGAAALAFSYAWVAWGAMDRRISVGEMAMLFIVLKQAQSIVAILIVSLAGMYEDNLYLSTLHELLAYPVPNNVGTHTTGPDPADGIRFQHVSFTYPGRAAPAIADVSFHLPRGKKLAIAGKNGAGKSTLVKLVTGLYSPSSGDISVDGRNVREWDRAALLRRMAVVLQDFSRYQLKAGHNIGFGDVAMLDDRARWEEAARAAWIHDEIESLPTGYETQLGRWFSEGQELSLGQWQRLALARAFMRKDAEFLIFDEPTSKLDPQAEAALLERLRQMPSNVTTLVVSHRMVTAALADEVLVLDAGRVVEQGSHGDLIARNGRYASLYQDQRSA